jgi:hypothetical protein
MGFTRITISQSDAGTETLIQVMIKPRCRSKVEFQRSTSQVNISNNVSTKTIREDL